MARKTAAGGASTLAGSIYQILWCLLRAVKVRVGAFRMEGPDPTGEASLPILVLEPLGGGGDLRIVGREFEVEQLKARADEGTWSLQSIIADVLPDLFLATDQAETKLCVYRFVTEGRLGNWAEVRSFFEGLRHRVLPSDAASALDDTRALRFQRQRSRKAGDGSANMFFPLSEYTEKALFLRIVDELKSRAAIRQLSLSETELHRRLWALLAHVEFLELMSTEAITREIDSLLAKVVDHRQDIPAIRRALAMSLLERASEGHFELATDDFLGQHGLRAAPLTEWAVIRDRAARELKSTIEEVKYDWNLDVRRELSRSTFELWGSSRKVLMVTGESGQGKTWLMAAIASSASADLAPVVWVDGKRDAERDLQAAADRFWLDIRGGTDSPIPLRQVANRLQEEVPEVSPHQLRVFIDGVADYPEALGIIREDWSARGIQLAISCSVAVAAAIQANYADRVFVQTCKDFSWEELHNLLQSRLGSEWASVPDHVRETLRRPLLAGIYCDELFEHTWIPTNEFELYQAAWKRLSTGPQTNTPLDVARVQSLAADVLSGSPYPWTAQHLLDRQIDDGCLIRLERSGWLVRTTDSRFRVFHDRLLNWATAHSLFCRFRQGTLTADEILSEIARISRHQGKFQFADLGFVPFDLLWLVAERQELAGSLVKDTLEALESAYPGRPEVMYREIIPALGPRIAPGLLARIREFEGVPWVLNAMMDALAATAGNRAAELASSLLDDGSPNLQRRGLKLARRIQCPELLDRIWSLHATATADPSAFLIGQEHPSVLRADSFGALQKAAENQCDWITRALENASTSDPVDDLGWLVHRQNDGGSSWKQCKGLLLAKVPPTKPRVLAANIGKYRDAKEIPWLRANLSNRVDVCGPVALSALARLDPDAAVSGLGELDAFELYLTRGQCFDEIRYRRPQATAVKVLECIRQADDPWRVALAFSERENAITAGILDELLDDLTERLDGLLLDERAENLDSLHRGLRFLAAIHDAPLIEAIRRRRGQRFESLLAQLLLRIGPRPTVDQHSLVYKPGIALLRTVGGSGFPVVVEDALQSPHRYGRLDALEWAPRLAPESTLRLIEKVVAQSETWDQDFPWEQSEAMEALAINSQWQSVADGLARWALKAGLLEQRLVPIDYTANWVDDLRAAVECDPTPGNVAALAFAGSSRDVLLLHRLLAGCDPTSELAHACVIGLELLDDKSDDGVRLVEPHLLNNHRYSATRMLTSANTPVAWDALLRDLRREFDHVTALNLINLTSYEQEVVELVAEGLPRYRGTNFWSLLYALVRHIRKPHSKAQLLADPWLRDTLHRAAVEAEGNFWIVGSKEAAIGCLAEIDRDAAFQAARRALLNEDSHDRARYPYLLLEIDLVQAIPFLIGALGQIRAPHVRVAIGRALQARQELSAQLRDCYHDSSKREAACFLAGFSVDGEAWRARLISALDDDDDRIVRTARMSLDRLADEKVCRQLLERAASAASQEDKWLYLDHFVEAIDPGDNDRFSWPQEALTVLETMSPLIRIILSKRLKDRRKAVNEELQNQKYDS